MSKSLLFIINGFGMGNATRCAALIDLLKNEYVIDVITSDKAYIYFQNQSDIRKLYRQQDIKLNTGTPYGTLRFFAKYLIHFCGRAAKNYFTQKKIIAEGHYDAVFFDSDYSFLFHRIFGDLKIVGINNALEVVHFYKNAGSVSPELRASLFLEQLDLFVYRFFCHHVLCPAIQWQDLRSKEKNIYISPLLIRQGLVKNTVPLIEDSVLIMASCSGAGSDLSVLSENLPETDITRIGQHLETDNISLVARADKIICNAGQSSISECLYLNKKALVIPIPRHAEQYANSVLAEKVGLSRHDSSAKTDSISHFIARKESPDYDYSFQKTEKILKDHLKKILAQL